MSKNPPKLADARERERALNLAKSFIVQAPAGSGKTELLVRRYLKLLGRVSAPERIVAMTFTNKAADELRERIVLALQNAEAGRRPKTAHEQQTFELAKQAAARSEDKNWQLSKTPARLKIMTIDALAHLIVFHSSLAGDTDNREILETRSRQDAVYRHAAERTLSRLEPDNSEDAIANVFLYLDNNVNRFVRLVAQMLAKRDQWLRHLNGGEMSIDGFKKVARTIIQTHLQNLKRAFEKSVPAEFFSLLENNDLMVEKLSEAPDAKIENLEQWQFIAKICLTKKDEWRKKYSKREGFTNDFKTERDLFTELIHDLSANENLRKSLAGVRDLPSADFDPKIESILKNIIATLQVAEAELAKIFRTDSVLDYIEISLIAERLLNDETDTTEVALFLDYQLQHLLIDEFQDISFSQYRLVQKLTQNWQPDDGRTLFFVGDPMQSIYRFREAEVGLFIKTKDGGFGNLPLDFLSLSVNFRATENLVESHNRYFAHIFPKTDEMHSGAICYHPSISATDEKSAAPEYYLNPEDGEAKCAASIIREAVDKFPAQNIAVLAPDRTPLHKVCEALAAAKIDFEAVDVVSLAGHEYSRDLLLLCRAILNIDDKLAWLAILRAPWCGLILDDLLVLADTEDETIYTRLLKLETLAELSEDGKIRARNFCRIIHYAVENSGRFSLASIVDDVAERLRHGREDWTESAIRKNFVLLVDDLERKRELNVDNLEAALSELYAPSAPSPVKLMTIHQAKGLEFDTVILCGLGKSSRSDAKPILQMREFFDDSLFLIPIDSPAATNENQNYHYLGNLEKAQNRFERMRLLYVAMTRAKRRLCLIGEVKKKRPPANSLLGFLWPFAEKFYPGPMDENLSAENAQNPPPLVRARRLIDHPPPRETADFAPGRFNLDLVYRSFFGTLAHRFFAAENLQPSAAQIDDAFCQINLPAALQKKYRARLRTLFKNMQGDPKVQWLFEKRPSTLVEAEFAGADGDIVVDRLFIDKNILWIIDYKTAEPAAGEAREIFIQKQKNEHRPQLEMYRRTLQKIYPNPIRSALYLPSVCEIVEID